jgi:hypothetical protein
MSGPPIHSCTIRNTISQVSSTFQQEGFGNPTISPSGKLNFEISQLLKAYEKQDPPRNCQPSLPLIYFETIIDIWDEAKQVDKQHTAAMCELTCLALLLALRSVEYVKTKDECPKTERLKRNDISFKFVGRKDRFNIVREQANFVLFTFRQQKNGIRNQTISRPRAINGNKIKICPVRLASSLITRLDSYGLDNPYINLTKIGSRIHEIKYQEIQKFQRTVAEQLGEDIIGFSPNRIGTHSMRVTFATFLYNQGLSDTIIMTEGRWQSTAFLRYIRSNTSQETYNVTEAISSMNNLSIILK